MQFWVPVYAGRHCNRTLQHSALAGSADGGVEALSDSNDAESHHDVQDLNQSQAMEGDGELHESDDGEQQGEDEAETSGNHGLPGEGDHGKDEDRDGDQKSDADVSGEKLHVLGPDEGSEDDGRKAEDADQHDESFQGQYSFTQ